MAIKVNFVILVAALFMARSASTEASAGSPGPTRESSAACISEPDGEVESSSFSVLLTVRNLAQGSVTFQLGSGSGMAGQALEVQAGQSAALRPLEVSVEHSVVQLGVTVTTHASSDAVKKVLYIDLAKDDFGDVKVEKGGRKSVAVTAVESWRLKSGKYLVILVGTERRVALSFKL